MKRDNKGSLSNLVQSLALASAMVGSGAYAKAPVVDTSYTPITITNQSDEERPYKMIVREDGRECVLEDVLAPFQSQKIDALNYCHMPKGIVSIEPKQLYKSSSVANGSVPGDHIFGGDGEGGFEDVPPKVVGLDFGMPWGSSAPSSYDGIADIVDSDNDGLLDPSVDVVPGGTYNVKIVTNMPVDSYTVSNLPSNMTYDSLTGIITYTPQPGDMGLKDIVIDVVNQYGSSDPKGAEYSVMTPRIVGIDRDNDRSNGIDFMDADLNNFIDDLIEQGCGGTHDYYVVVEPQSFYNYSMTNNPANMNIDGITGKILFGQGCPGGGSFYNPQFSAGNGVSQSPWITAFFQVN